MLNFLRLKKVGFVYSRVLVGAGAYQKFYPEPKPHKNYAAPQYCMSYTVLPLLLLYFRFFASF
jgi:hypothetical protein